MLVLLSIVISVGLSFEYVLIRVTGFLGSHLAWVEVAVATISAWCQHLWWAYVPDKTWPDPGLNISTKKASGQVQWQGKSISSHSLSMVGSESEVAQSCPTLCNPMDCSLSASAVHQIFQARVLEWIVISFSRGSSWPRNRTQVSRIAGRRFTAWATGEAPCYG